MQLNSKTNACECMTGYARQIKSSGGFTCIDPAKTVCESKTTLTLDKTACVFVYPGVCGQHAEVVEAAKDENGPAGSRCACTTGWTLDSDSKCGECDTAAAFVPLNGECVCDTKRFLAF